MSPRYRLRERLLLAVCGRIANWLIGALYATVRFVNDPHGLSVLNRNPSPPGIFPFWHSHQLSMLHFHRHTGSAILVSRSRDGEYIARIARQAGFLPVRGSSSRSGAQGLREMVRLAAKGHPIAITPDGPRGPRQCVHPGVIALARNSGQIITPVAIGLSGFWEIPSWDRFRIPKPFSTACSCWGKPLSIPPDADEAAIERYAEMLRQRLLALEKRADRLARRLHAGCRPIDLLPGG